MNVLVTGGSGYIGSHACVELIEFGYKPIVVDNLINSSAESLKCVEDITGYVVPFYKVDIRNKAKLRCIFDRHSIVW